jgi:hypothetical protein
VMFQQISRNRLRLSGASMSVSVACLIVGIVGSATNTVLGLEPTDWFIIAVGFGVAGCWNVLQGLARSIK